MIYFFGFSSIPVHSSLLYFYLPYFNIIIYRDRCLYSPYPFEFLAVIIIIIHIIHSKYFLVRSVFFLIIILNNTGLVYCSIVLLFSIVVVVVDFFIIGIVVVFLYLLDVKLLIWSLLVYFRTDYFFCILLLGVVIFIFCMILLFPA